jgi:formylglycine-generating enzyme required for sulfatase activity
MPVKGTEVMFCIHETRRQDYAAFAADASGVDESWKQQQFKGIPCGDKDDHPVVGVGWEDAVKFCEWLSKKEGKTYRLPTDAEWSIAVGLGDRESRSKETTPEMLNSQERSLLPWEGDYPPKSEDKAGNYADTASTEKVPGGSGLKDYTDGFATTAPVMSFKMSSFGLYDMGGNVWEWVHDKWSEAKTDRVLRGASFIDHDRNYLLSSYRTLFYPAGRSCHIGFRVVMVAR